MTSEEGSFDDGSHAGVSSTFTSFGGAGADNAGPAQAATIKITRANVINGPRPGVTAVVILRM